MCRLATFDHKQFSVLNVLLPVLLLVLVEVLEVYNNNQKLVGNAHIQMPFRYSTIGPMKVLKLKLLA